MRITIIGCGTLGEAILAGLLASGTTNKSNVAVTTRRQSHADDLAERHGVAASTDNVAAVAEAEIVLVAVKPQRARELLPTLADALAGKLVICTCAGVRLSDYQTWLPESQVIRAMPNTPCLIREGMTVLAAGAGVEFAQLENGKRIFSAVGRCTVLEEKHMDAVTGLSGSGPAFAFVMLEALADGGVMMGLPRDAAVELAAQRGYRPQQVDAVISLQRPKLAPHSEAMRRRVAQILGLPLDDVSVKAKTGEGIGPIGESRAIEVEAIATLVRLSPS